MREKGYSKLKIFIIVSLLMLIPLYVYGAPNINNVSGEIKHNSNMVINGNGFGTKSPAAPVSFLNFESGSIGADISESGWTTSGQSANDRPEYSSTHYGQGSLGMRCNPKGDQVSSALYHSLSSGNQKFYITYNTYRVGNMGALGKYVRVQSYSPQYPELVLKDGTVTVGNGGGSYGHNEYFSPSKNKWSRDEIYFYAGTQGSSNGSYTYWMHNIGSSIGSYSQSSCTVYTNSNRIGRVKIGAEYQPSGAYNYIDNIYIDITRARVEVGNASTWNACTHREIQIPTSWSNNSIGITFNQGSFGNSQTAYLYIVDANGNMNSNGYPVTIGGGGGGGAGIPDPPQGLTVVVK